MTCDPGSHSCFPDLRDSNRHLLQFIMSQQKIHHAAVYKTSLCTSCDGVPYPEADTSNERAGLSDPLNGASLIPVLKEKAHHVMVGPACVSIDAQLFGSL